MRKRMLSILLSLCMLFSLAPASVFAQDELEETDECVCETQCSEESINNDCPVCSKEGATLEDCRMYVPVIEESNETIINPINENNNEDSTYNVVLENESNLLENEEENNVTVITSKDVQDLIDALPDTTTINEDNVEEIEAQLEAIDNLKADLSDEELDNVDFTRYVEVSTVLEQLLYGVQESSNQIMQASYSGRSIRLGTSGISSPSKLTSQKGNTYNPNSYIYFGVNSKDNNKPIKWRVLDANKANDGSTAGMFLLSEYLFRKRSFGSNNTWQNSSVQQWCKDFASNQPNFSLAEKSAMLGVAKTDSGGNYFNISWGESSLTADDKMFFLSVRELADYVGSYNGAPGLAAKSVGGNSSVWWLRSPDASSTDQAGAVFPNSGVGYCRVEIARAARPAFNLDLNAVLFTSAATNGKPEGLNKIGNYNGNEWKLTLLDNSRNFAVTETTASGKPGDTVTLNYTGAATGTNEYISVILADKNGTQYYGRVAKPDAESGTVNVTIPTGLTDGTYTLYVFSEQYNGDYKTDYASAFDKVALTVNSGDTTPDYYRLTFDTNGGSEVASIRRAEYSTIDLSNYKPTREGYEFIGWYADENLTEKITSIRLTRNTTVYAGWEENPSTGFENPFTDVSESDWFFGDVKFVYQNGLMNGTSSTTFSPDGTTSRGMIVTILWRMAGSPDMKDEILGYPFQDVDANAYYATAVYWARLNGIADGYGDNTFGPDKPITREQMAVMLYRYAQHKGYDTTQGGICRLRPDFLLCA